MRMPSGAGKRIGRRSRPHRPRNSWAEVRGRGLGRPKMFAHMSELREVEHGSVFVRQTLSGFGLLCPMPIVDVTFTRALLRCCMYPTQTLSGAAVLAQKPICVLRSASRRLRPPSASRLRARARPRIDRTPSRCPTSPWRTARRRSARASPLRLAWELLRRSGVGAARHLPRASGLGYLDGCRPDRLGAADDVPSGSPDFRVPSGSGAAPGGSGPSARPVGRTHLGPRSSGDSLPSDFRPPRPAHEARQRSRIPTRDQGNCGQCSAAPVPKVEFGPTPKLIKLGPFAVQALSDSAGGAAAPVFFGGCPISAG